MTETITRNCLRCDKNETCKLFIWQIAATIREAGCETTANFIKKEAEK